MATKLNVKTDVGTFKRTTVRVYTHLVVVGPVRLERLEADRRQSILSLQHEAARYRRVIAEGRDATDQTAFSREFTANKIADGSFQLWALSADTQAQALLSKGPVTEDQGEPFVLGWCGRLDLARKLKTSTQAARYRWARVFDVTTGQEVL